MSEGRVSNPDARQRVQVAVVGTVNLDHSVRVPRLPARGETVVGDDVATAPGGKGANQAVAAARQGARTALVGCVGHDGAGDRVLEFLAAEPSLDLRGVARAGGSSGAAFVVVDDLGHNTIVSARGANRSLDRAHVERHGRTIAEASVLLVQLGVPVDSVHAALEIAHSVGTITILDPSPPGDLPADLAVDVLRLVDVCTPNESEVERLTGVRVTEGAPVQQAAEALVARGCASVVITLAERGAFYAGPDGCSAVDPFPVDAVDPTGAGDAFCGALAAALADGAAMRHALVAASAAGALAATRAGAAPSMPSRAEVEAFASRAGRRLG